MLDLPLVIFFIFGLKLDKNAGLTPCDLFHFGLKLDKNAGLNPCDFFHFWSQIG